MADRSHLTPVTTTDRRGRITTVYRNLAARLLPARGAKRTAQLPHLPRAPRDADWLDTTISGDALAAELAASGKLTKDDTDRILFNIGEHSSGHVVDTLRICAQLRAADATASTWSTNIGWAVNGIRERDIDGPPLLSTSSDVQAAAAVVTFVVRVPRLRRMPLRTHTYGRTASYGVMVHRVAHPGLEAVIRSRPGDIERIIAYATDRGMDERTPLEPLLDWLDSDTPPTLDSGWL